MKLLYIFILLLSLTFEISDSLRLKRADETTIPTTPSTPIGGEAATQKSQETSTQNLKSSTNTSLSTINNSGENFPPNETYSHESASTSQHPTTTKRSTTLRTTKPVTSRTTRSTTRRTTTLRTTKHVGVTGTSSSNDTSENRTEESNIVTTTARHVNTLRLRSTTPPSIKIIVNESESVNTTDSEFDYVWEEVSGGPSNAIDNTASTDVPASHSSVPKPTYNIVELAATIGLGTFCDFIKISGLDATLNETGPYTIFAPSDKSFNSVPYFIGSEYFTQADKIKSILQYHIVKGAQRSTDFKNDQLLATLNPGKDIRINIYPVTQKNKLITATGAHISFANYQASNGIIHVIERVLFRIPEVTLVDALKKTPKFKFFGHMIEIADFAKELEGGSFTMFAPTQVAFDKLSPVDKDRLLSDKEALLSILRYHVVPGTYFFSSLKPGHELPSLNKDMPLRFMFTKDFIKVNKASFIEMDIPVTNGVIHGINALLLPTTPSHGGQPAHDMDALPHDSNTPSHDKTDQSHDETTQSHNMNGKPGEESEEAPVIADQVPQDSMQH